MYYITLLKGKLASPRCVKTVSFRTIAISNAILTDVHSAKFNATVPPPRLSFLRAMQGSRTGINLGRVNVSSRRTKYYIHFWYATNDRR